MLLLAVVEIPVAGLTPINMTSPSGKVTWLSVDTDPDLPKRKFKCIDGQHRLSAVTHLNKDGTTDMQAIPRCYIVDSKGLSTLEVMDMGKLLNDTSTTVVTRLGPDIMHEVRTRRV